MGRILRMGVGWRSTGAGGRPSVGVQPYVAIKLKMELNFIKNSIDFGRSSIDDDDIRAKE
jgi:hypothetical protein